MICLKLATRTGSFQVEVDATPADCGVANINYERKPLAVPGTRNTGTNYADSRYQLPQIDTSLVRREALLVPCQTLLSGTQTAPPWSSSAWLRLTLRWLGGWLGCGLFELVVVTHVIEVELLRLIHYGACVLVGLVGAVITKGAYRAGPVDSLARNAGSVGRG